MSILHVIKPDGTVDSAEWTGPLENKCVPTDEMRQRIGCKYLEHVSVLWQGRRMHMFVDEDGRLQTRQLYNLKASAIYAAYYVKRFGGKPYSDLAKVPEPEETLPECIIIGTACLWEGEVE